MRTTIVIAAAALLAGCSKCVEYGTTYRTVPAQSFTRRDYFGQLVTTHYPAYQQPRRVCLRREATK